MKRSRKMDQRQAQMFFERRLSNNAHAPELPADRKAELAERLAELLLKTARDNSENPTGGDHDA